MRWVSALRWGGASRVAGILAAAVFGAGCTGPESPGPVLPAATGTQWRQLAAATSMRTEVTAAAAGSRVHVIGGYRGDGATVATVEVFDTATGGWQAGPDLPVAVNHAMATTLEGTVYVFGGYLAGNVPSTAAFRLEATGWRAVAPLPQGRAAGTAVGIAATAYLAGGIVPGSKLAEDMLVYDSVADSWSSAPGPPTPREHLGGAGFAGLVYTVGGRASGAGNLAAFEVYDPRSGQWRTLADLPTRRGGLAAAATCSGHVVAVGGEAAATFSEVEAFEVRTGRWLRLPPLPTPRHGLGVVVIGPVVYTLSGGPRPGLHVSAATESIDLTPLDTDRSCASGPISLAGLTGLESGSSMIAAYGDLGPAGCPAGGPAGGPAGSVGRRYCGRFGHCGPRWCVQAAITGEPNTQYPPLDTRGAFNPRGTAGCAMVKARCGWIPDA